MDTTAKPKKSLLPIFKSRSKSSNRWSRSQKSHPDYDSVVERKVFLGSSSSKGIMDGNIAKVTSFNINSPAYKKISQKSIICDADAPMICVADTSFSQKRKRDEMEDIYQAMKKLKTDDEVTKRLLLVVHYMNQQPNPREISIDAKTGVVNFGQFL